MIVTVRMSDQPTDSRREYWNWCFQNGFIATEMADSVVVDTDQRTVTVHRLLPVSQPGDPDFPELRRDEHNRPLTEVKIFTLTAPVPAWMVAEAAERIAA